MPCKRGSTYILIFSSIVYNFLGLLWPQKGGLQQQGFFLADVHRAMLPLTAPWTPLLHLFLVLVNTAHPWHPLACRFIVLVSGSVFTQASSLYLYMFLRLLSSYYKDTSHLI